MLCSIRIPFFCCNVSDKDSDRQTIIKRMIKGVLAAVSASEVNCITRDYSVWVVSKTRNGVTGNDVTRNRVTGIFSCFFSDSAVNIFQIIVKKIENEGEI